MYQTKLSTLIVFLLLAFVGVRQSNAQVSHQDNPEGSGKDWLQMMQDPDSRVRDVQNAFYQWWEIRSHELEMEKEQLGETEDEGAEGEVEGVGYQIFKRWEYINQFRVLPDGKRPAPDYVKAQYENYMSQLDGSNSNAGNWSIVGMSAYPTNNTGQPTGMGRVNAIAFHPTDPNTIFIGAPSGGFFKTTNPNGNLTTWTNLSSTLPTLGVSSILVDPGNPNIIYLGTGDRDSDDAPGIGVYKTSDGGNSWTQKATGMGNATVGAMVMHPSDPNTIIAATSTGIYKTTDGGNSWSLRISGNFKDLKLKPGDPSTVYAVRIVTPSEFYRSTDNGSSWTKINTIPSSGIGSRMVIGVTPANPQVVYLVQCKSDNTFSNLIRSTDSGLNFTAMAVSPPNILSSNCDGTGTTTQATYDLCIAVDPNNANTVIVGGVDVWKTTDAGATWAIKAIWAGNCSGTAVAMHADHHVMEWSPWNGGLYVGNDGGISYSTTLANTWTEITGALPVTQIYKIGQGASNANFTIFGCQDNGSNGTVNGSTFYTTRGGDGMECLIDYANSNYAYNTYVSGSINRSSTGPLGSYSYSLAGNGVNGIDETGAWVTPYFLHKTDHFTMFAGYKNVWRTNNVTSSPPTWTKISTGETNTCSVLEQSLADPNIIYVVRPDYWDGTQWITGNIKRTDNANATAASVTWTSITLPGGKFPTDIKAHPTNANIVYATAGTKIYKSSDKGITWTDISVNLPSISINCLVYDKNSNEGIYIGNQTGVWYKNADMPYWALFSNGLPPVDIRELEIYYDAVASNSRIKAGTYGRGLWQSDLITVNVIDPTNLTAVPASPTQINLAWTKNASNDNVMVAVNTTSTFGTPIDGTPYVATNQINGGGTVIYNGSASLFNHTLLSSNTAYYYKSWSVNASNQYSNGITAYANTPCTAVAAPLNETFTTGTIPSCWTQNNTSAGGSSWQFGVLSGYGSSDPVLNGNFAYFLSNYGSGQSENASLFTVPVNLSGYSNVLLRFMHYFRSSSSYASTASIAYSLDYGGTWTNLKSITSSTVNPETEAILVPGAAGQPAVMFRFTYTTTSGAYYWAIDNVEVKDCQGVWTGTTSTDWHTASNWCNNAVPTATTDVIVPAGVTNMPYISSTTIATCKDMFLSTGTTLKMAVNTELDVKGNWTNNGNFDYSNSGSSAMVKFNGSVPQTYGGSSILTLKRLTIDNPQGITISKELRGDNIWLTNGLVNTGTSGKLNVFGGSVTRTNGYVNGTLQKYMFTNPSTVTNVTFEIGDAANYVPVAFSFPTGSITAASGFAVRTTTGDHANVGSSTLDPGLSINRNWSFPYVGLTFSSCSATFNFVNGDVDAGTIPANLIAGKYASSAWSYPAVGTKTATSVQVTGLTSSTLGDIQLAETVSVIDWANLQWPSSGTIDQGGTYNVYAQVYEPNVTPGAGKGAGIQCWIGYSTSNTDPSTWTNWVLATYNSDAGNNDEYVANLGTSITSPGIYYYASRFKRGSSAYVYGGFQGGFWNGTSNNNGTLTVNAVQLDWVNLQYPASASIAVGGNVTVYAQVYEPGLTQGAGQGANITAWIGYSSTNDDPATGSGWNWIPATYNNTVTGNNDEYFAAIGSSLAPGTYYYASRFQLGTSPYMYGGLTGIWSSGNSGVLIVSGPTFTGTGNWTEAARWNTATVPVSSDNVTIDGACTITGAVTIANLTINASKNLVISSSGELTVTGVLTNNAGTTGLVINSDATSTGSLIQSNPNVPATVQRFLTKYNAVPDQMFHFLSSPVSSQAITPEFQTMTNTTDDFYKWGEITNEWINTKQGLGVPFTWNPDFENNFSVGRGYLIAYPVDLTKTFSGVLNNGDFSPSLSYTTSGGNGWNLIGNPYSSAIDWDLVTSAQYSDLDNAVYVWDNANQNYLTWVGNAGSLPNGIIPSMQGFFVKANAASPTLTLHNSNRVHEGAAYYKNSSMVDNMVQLEVEGNAHHDDVFIRFTDEATQGFDAKWDAYKLSGAESVPEFSSYTNDLKLSINSLPLSSMNASVPLSLKVGADASYSIRLVGNTMATTVQLILEDLKTGQSQELKSNPIYSFTAGTIDDPNRFHLHFKEANAVEEHDLSKLINIVVGDGLLTITNSETISGKVNLLDVAGRIINSTSLIPGSPTKINMSETSGVYIINVMTPRGSFNQKVIVK